jgi:hypothetical protein
MRLRGLTPLTPIIAACCVALASLSLTWGQSQAFEVASIKLSRDSSAESNLDSAPGGRLTATNITVRELIRLAY